MLGLDMFAAGRTNDRPKHQPIGPPQGQDNAADQDGDGGTMLTSTEMSGAIALDRDKWEEDREAFATERY